MSFIAIYYNNDQFEKESPSLWLEGSEYTYYI